jgi:superfamily II DNA or RNA helicase
MTHRLFTQAQRGVIYLLACGHCQRCGIRLNPADWHADHVEPFSKGGATRLNNAQALCPECNLAKGALMSLSPLQYVPQGAGLRKWQMEFVDRFIPFAKEQLVRPVDSVQAFVLNAFPGSGKTWAQLLTMAYLFKEKYVDFVVVCVPTDPLRSQFADEARRFGLYLHAKKNIKVNFKAVHGIVLTYGQLANPTTVQALDLWCQQMKVFVSADEMHHLSQRRSWGRNFFDAFDNSRVRLLTSGTPFRSDGDAIPWVRYQGQTIDLSAPLAYSYGYGPSRWNPKLSALSEGDVRDVVFHPWDGQIEFKITQDGEEQVFVHRLTDNLDEIYADQEPRFLQLLKSARRRACIECGTARHPKGTPYVREQIAAAHRNLMEIRKIHFWAGGLIVCESQKHADAVAEAVKEITGTTPVVIHGEVGEAKRKLQAFKEDRTPKRAPWLIAVKMVTEGVDIKQLRVCVYLTKETAPLFWTQVLGRILRVEDGLPEQTAHFYQYDDGIDHNADGEPEDVRLRWYAKAILEEKEFRVTQRVDDDRPQGPPWLCPICRDDSSQFYTGNCPGKGIDPCPVRLPATVECINATGEAVVQFYNGDEHEVANLTVYNPVAVAWNMPAAKVKSYFDKLPPETLEQVLEAIKK